jgi:hypothetical protein
MDHQVARVLVTLRDLGSPAEIWTLAEKGFGPAVPPALNAHIHLPPNFSAFETVQDAVDLAAEQQVRILGVSNYYDFTVYGDFAERARAAGIFPLFGLEIIAMQEDLRAAGVKVNDPGNPGKTYLCGKGITRFSELTAEGNRLLSAIRQNDSQRMRLMVDRLREACAERGLETAVDEAAVVDMIARRHGSPRTTIYLQERHIAQAFQEAFTAQVPADQRTEKLNQVLAATTKAQGQDDAVGIQNDLRSHLLKSGKPAFVAESFLSFAEARQLVLELGGIPCYPVLADGAAPVCPFEAEPKKLIDTLLDRGIHAAEWIPSRNSVKTLHRYLPVMREAGFLLTVGTEHNTLDRAPLVPACLDGPVPADLQTLFWEGACVVAAHQFLTLHGACGYVDAAGHPHPAFGSANERINQLAKIGAAVMGRYWEKCG